MATKLTPGFWRKSFLVSFLTPIRCIATRPFLHERKIQRKNFLLVLENYLLRGDYYQALQAVKLTNIEKFDSKRKSEILSIKGYCHLQLKEYKEAIQDYEQAIKLDENNAENYFFLGYSSQGQHKYEDSLTYYTKALEYGRNDFHVYNNRGVVLIKLGKILEGIQDFEKALEFDPKNLFPYLNISHLLCDSKNYEKALEILDKAAKYHPHNSLIHFNRSMIFFHQQQLDKAEIEIDKSLLHNPDDYQAITFKDNLLKEIEARK